MTTTVQIIIYYASVVVVVIVQYFLILFTRSRLCAHSVRLGEAAAAAASDRIHRL